MSWQFSNISTFHGVITLFSGCEVVTQHWPGLQAVRLMKLSVYRGEGLTSVRCQLLNASYLFSLPCTRCTYYLTADEVYTRTYAHTCTYRQVWYIVIVIALSSSRADTPPPSHPLHLSSLPPSLFLGHLRLFQNFPSSQLLHFLSLRLIMRVLCTLLCKHLSDLNSNKGQFVS